MRNAQYFGLQTAFRNTSVKSIETPLILEQGWDSDVIERHLPERVKLMQHWADYLDGLKAGAEVIPINRRQA